MKILFKTGLIMALLAMIAIPAFACNDMGPPGSAVNMMKSDVIVNGTMATHENMAFNMGPDKGSPPIAITEDRNIEKSQQANAPPIDAMMEATAIDDANPANTIGGNAVAENAIVQRRDAGRIEAAAQAGIILRKDSGRKEGWRSEAALNVHQPKATARNGSIETNPTTAMNFAMTNDGAKYRAPTRLNLRL